MLVESGTNFFGSSDYRRRRKRRNTLYFSSSKALRRSRMKKGSRVSSKLAQNAGDLRRSLRFEGGGAGQDEEDVMHDAEVVQEMYTDNLSTEEAGRALDSASVRSFGKLLFYTAASLVCYFMQLSRVHYST